MCSRGKSVGVWEKGRWWWWKRQRITVRGTGYIKERGVEERGRARGRVTESLRNYRTAHHQEGLKKRNERSENRPFTEENNKETPEGQAPTLKLPVS